MVAIVLLMIASLEFGAGGPLSSDPALFWVGVVTVLLFAGASLSLAPLALGARGGHALKTTVLSSLVFGACVFFFFASLVTVSSVPRLISLVAVVGTPAIGSLLAVRDEGGYIAVRLGGVPLIVAAAIYCASLLAYWLVPGDNFWASFLAPFVVAASSWPVLPAIVVALRSG
jgi:hypothetical protein